MPITKSISIFLLAALLLAPALCFAASPPDGVYDLSVAGEKSGTAIVEKGLFVRPVQVGTCLFAEAQGKVSVLNGVDGLNLDIPDQCLPALTLDLRSNTGPLKFQKSTSFFLNSSMSTTDGNIPQINLASGLYLREHYIYSDAFMDTQTSRYNRGDSHISRDVPEFLSRVTMGDHNSEPGSALAPGKRLMGVKIARNWAQDSDRAASIYFSSSQTLKIISRSSVEFYRDGILVDRRDMSPGDYNIRNLPAAAYSSKLRIRVIDTFGNITEIDADVITPPQLLAKGILDYSFSLGSERTGFDGLGDYKGFTGGGFIGYGLTDKISVASSFSDKMATATTTVATPLGLFAAEARLDSLGSWRAAYSYGRKNIGLNAEYKIQDNKTFAAASVSAGFDTYGTITCRVNQSHDLQAYSIHHALSLPLGVSSLTTITIDQLGKISYGAILIKQWSRRLSSQISYAKSLDRSETLYAQISFALDRGIPASVGVRASSQTIDGKTTVQTLMEGRAGIYASASTDTPPAGKTTTTGTVAGSLACVGSTCRVGEPVAGSFAIGDGLQASGQAGSVLNVPPYSNTLLSANTRTAQENQVIALRPGQGFKLTTSNKVDAMGLVAVNGHPAGGIVVTWEGGETITGEDGLLWISRVEKKPLELIIGGRQVVLKMDREVENGVLDLGLINIWNLEAKNGNKH